MSDENIYYEKEEQAEQTVEENDVSYEDIKSYTGSSRRKNKNRWRLSELKEDPLTEYGNGIFKKLGGIIKAISFMVSFFIFAVTLVLSFILYSIDKFFMPFALALLIFGVMFALITMFLIYGIGQVIAQNNEILRRLEKKGYHR